MPRSEEEERLARYAEFEVSYARSVRERLEHAFIHTFRPGFDDGPPMRSWASTREYRKWCEENLEPWLGYGPATSAVRQQQERCNEPNSGG